MPCHKIVIRALFASRLHAKTSCLLVAVNEGATLHNFRCPLVIATVIKGNKTVETYCLLYSCSAVIIEVL